MRRALALLVAAPWIAWAVVRALGLQTRYPLVQALAFTPYVALSAPLPLVVALILRRWGVAVLAALAAAVLALAVVPRALAGPRPDAGGPVVTVMTANLYVGRGDPAAVVRAVRAQHVDVLSLQELTPAELARLDAAGLPSLLPHRYVQVGDGAHGSGLFSRLPLRGVAQPPALRGSAQPAALIAVAGAPPLRVKAIHPTPPISPVRTSAWRASLRALPGADSRGDVQVLAGDFNATLDHPELRAVLSRGWIDAADAAGAGLAWTWPARNHPHLHMKVTIDHVLVDERVRVLSVTAIPIPGSDHRGLIARLRLPRRA